MALFPIEPVHACTCKRAGYAARARRYSFPTTRIPPMRLPRLHSLIVGMPLLTCLAQEPAPTPPTPPAPTTHHVVVRYPQDKDRAIAVVGSRTLTLGDLVDHLDKRHHPGLREAMSRPEIQRLLQSDLIAPWTRHFADLEALRQTFGDEIDEAKLEQSKSDALKQSFQAWLDSYVAKRRDAGRPTELTTAQVNNHLTRFQLHNGLAAELQGTLDHLEPGDYHRGQLHAFFTANPRTFGGQVTIAHILVQHRDGGTGILLDDAGTALANARIADIKARLRPDGSNFEEVAQAWSDDAKTAPDGGKLGPVHRHDDRMPAALCRAAWELKDGEVSGVVETQYGWHIIKRLEFAQHVFILFTDDAMPDIKRVMRRAMQEERLFKARAQAKVRLLL